MSAAAAKLVSATAGSDKAVLEQALKDAQAAHVSYDLLLAGVQKMALLDATGKGKGGKAPAEPAAVPYSFPTFPTCGCCSRRWTP